MADYSNMDHSELVVEADKLLAIKDNPNADPQDRAAAEAEYTILNQSAQVLNLTDKQVVSGSLDIGISSGEIRRALGFMVRTADHLLQIIHNPDSDPDAVIEAQREYDALNTRVHDINTGAESPTELVKETRGLPDPISKGLPDPISKGLEGLDLSP